MYHTGTALTLLKGSRKACIRFLIPQKLLNVCNMSMQTIATLKRISAEDLKTRLKSPTASTIAIVDVRDDDHIGGHIKGSIHSPSSSLDYRMPELVRKLADKEVVVFHCALSQQRGPSAALRYLREREQKTQQGELFVTDKAPGQDFEQEGKKAEQEVYVLDRGFVGWGKLYGRDETVTEGYAADIWEEYD